jgi:hypothetical protein
VRRAKGLSEKDLKRQRDARYRQKHKARTAARHAEYNRTHRQERLKWKRDNKARLLAYSAEYYHTHVHKDRTAYQAEYRCMHRQERRDYLKVARAELHDWYVVWNLGVKLAVKDVPRALIELKRAQIIGIRALKRSTQ